ncbi:NACHT domain-containing NTPase [Cyanobacteria bacterium FACHB-63]|nr:NACHT domain-containing NTPase [Cyanobacteria bacterium FACHB-63]
MARQSLRASEEGIKAARKAYKAQGWTQEALAEEINCKTRQPISNFFARKAIDKHNFIEICTALDLNWENIRESESDTAIDSSEIDAIVQSIRESVRSFIQEQCGTMRVLDMTQPIELTGDRGIYTNVNILERLTKHRRLEIEQLLRGSTLEEFDRFGLSGITEERVLGLEAVKRHSKSMVLGKPGAGKTTFLKYLAMACIESLEFGDRVPIFITLKRFAELDEQPDLRSYIRSIVNAGNNAEIAEQLFNQGKLLILLDGLDEVREEDTRRTIEHIEQFSRQYPKNQFVMTCRIASKEYTFEKFTEVEVADFDDEQIATFVLNWFQCKDPDHAEERSTTLIENLNNNEPIKELASNPLLLTLICLECEESLEFPKNRAELYDRGLRVLLTKWDANRGIYRDQVYKKLSLKRKEDLLSQIALTTFTNKDYFIKQRILEGYISDYIRNLPDVATDPEALQVDSEAVLKSIESQHGLLVARATGIYSFSHLTFQEYFVAQEIMKKSAYELLLQQLHDLRWREVCLLTVNMLPDSSILLQQIKTRVDGLLAGDEKLYSFMSWVHEKAQSVEAPFSRQIIRAFYFSLGQIEPYGGININLLCSLGITDEDILFGNAFQDGQENLRKLAFDQNLVWCLLNAIELNYFYSDQIEAFLLGATDSATSEETRDCLNLSGVSSTF